VIRKTEISLGSLYCQLLAAETRLELQNSQYQSSANSSACGYGSYHGRGGCQGDGGDRGGFGGHGKAGSGSRTRPVYQLCKMIGLTVMHCWKHFDHNFTGEEKTANNAEGHGCNVDTTWY
jgi:hypothetical protein